MNVPDGERLLLTIDRVVERDCERCGGYKYKEPCPGCHGTGRLNVRVRGWCEISDAESEWESRSVEYEVCEMGEFYVTGSLDEVRDAVVAAYLAGTLPPDIAANITEEEAPDG